MANPFWKLITESMRALYFWMIAVFQFFIPPPRKDVRGKIVLVTGAGSGLGMYYIPSRLCFSYSN